MKRVISLLLCVFMLVPVMASCAKKDENDKGAAITMYLTQQVYDLDPAKAYNNESALRLVSLVFDNLFVIDENGKLKKSLAESYEIKEDEKANEYKMVITLKETKWTDGTQVTANDVYYAWTRVLQSDNDFAAACLLFDIKNARAAKEGNVSIDDVGISANNLELEITFEGKIDYDQFLINIASYALCPLREDIVGKTTDWAKKPSTICSSGPFRLKKVSYKEGEESLLLERNAYYFRDIEKDDIDESVTPYRIIVDYTLSDEEIMTKYANGEIFFVGDIPLSMRGNYKDHKDIVDTMSTHLYMLNENVVISEYNASGFKKLASTSDLKKGDAYKPTESALTWERGEVTGEKIFANPVVREAMSLAIDRDAIADAVVFARAATALVPYGVYDSTSKKDLFREVGSDILATSSKMTDAKQLLENAGFNASKYMFSISVAAYDDVHMKIAEMVQAAWTELGFHVQIKAIDVVTNTDTMKSIDSVPEDIVDDLFAESVQAGYFEVAAIDYTALSADAFSVLAPFAKCFTGRNAESVSDGTGNIEFVINSHITGYNSEEYNALIERAYAQKDIEARASILHEAEQLLLKDLPVIPIIFNQNLTLEHDDLSKVDYTYYGTMIFTKTKLKDYVVDYE